MTPEQLSILRDQEAQAYQFPLWVWTPLILLGTYTLSEWWGQVWQSWQERRRRT